MSAIDIFTRESVDYNLPPGVEHRNYEYPLETGENRALQLAESQGFYEMCADVLWGSEDRVAFGEMLRGIVVTFLPKNRMHLELLRNIAYCQWSLRRIGAIQSNLFEHNQDSRGEYGLPTGTINAMKFRAEASYLMNDLRQAINTYRSIRRGK